MILSPYRNPPYRTPTPKNSGSPPPEPSPKRKRADSEKSVAPLHIDTTEARDFAPESGADSPRTKVAEKLHDLNLQHTQSPHVPPAAEPTGAPRKRLKRGQALRRDAPGYESDLDLYSTPESSSQPAIYSRDASPIEIDETPGCRTRIPSSSPPTPGPPPVPLNLSSVIFGETGYQRNVHSAPTTQSSQNRDETVGSVLSPASSTEDASLDQIAMTWQDDEITGHDIDTTTPDDDGLGINGIGFKPTAAIAYARSQKRKQQVTEWRAREARDSRQKRFERRRGAGRGGSSTDASTKRSVRFEGVG